MPSVPGSTVTSKPSEVTGCPSDFKVDLGGGAWGQLPGTLKLTSLGGGFKHFLFSPLLGEDRHFD